jgi:quinol monooxygenase YgiN
MTQNGWMDHHPNVLLTGRVGLFVRLPGLPGARPALLDRLHTYADRLGEEPGTELFVISTDPGDPDVVWLNEWFHDESALEAHRNAPAFADLLGSMPELLSGPAGILRIDPLRLDLTPALAAELTAG